jgi:hypothetical protein
MRRERNVTRQLDRNAVTCAWEFSSFAWPLYVQTNTPLLPSDSSSKWLAHPRLAVYARKLHHPATLPCGAARRCLGVGFADEYSAATRTTCEGCSVCPFATISGEDAEALRNDDPSTGGW